MKFDIPYEFGQEVWFLKGKPVKGNIGSVQIYPSGTIRYGILPINYDGNNVAFVTEKDIFNSKEDASERLSELKQGKQLSLI